MTLHWWMHWFWVTSQFLVILGNPVPSSTVEPRGQVQDHPAAESTSEIPPSAETEGLYRDPNPSRQSFRVAKAIGFYPPTNTAVILDRQRVTTISGTMERESTVESSTVAVEQSLPVNNGSGVVNLDVAETLAPRRTLENAERNRNQVTKKDSKITWISSATNKTARSKYYEQEEKVEEDRNPGAGTDDLEDLTVLPLQEEVSRIRLVLNKTRSSSVSAPSSSSVSSSVGNSDAKTFNRSDDDVEIDEEFAEPQLFATAASIVEVGASEATRLSRARSAFPKDFQRDQIQGSEGNPFDYGDSDSNENSEQASSKSAIDIAAITGSCLATVLLLSTMGSLGFIMYRRRYLNPPQTLNSDKCSNPDSSGYIDDSTIRDNSEEMYSLDNDSFLNSLEAMTIQNYWTDSVKHTKL